LFLELYTVTLLPITDALLVSPRRQADNATDKATLVRIIRRGAAAQTQDHREMAQQRDPIPVPVTHAATHLGPPLCDAHVIRQLIECLNMLVVGFELVLESPRVRARILLLVLTSSRGRRNSKRRRKKPQSPFKTKIREKEAASYRGRWAAIAAYRSFAFQTGLVLRSAEPFFARPDLRGSLGGELADEWDEQIGDLQYRDVFKYAVGHGVAAGCNPSSAPATRRVAC
jgi:hypothetical protein